MSLGLYIWHTYTMYLIHVEASCSTWAGPWYHLRSSWTCRQCWICLCHSFCLWDCSSIPSNYQIGISSSSASSGLHLTVIYWLRYLWCYWCSAIALTLIILPSCFLPNPVNEEKPCLNFSNIWTLGRLLQMTNQLHNSIPITRPSLEALQQKSLLFCYSLGCYLFDDVSYFSLFITPYCLCEDSQNYFL